MFVVLINKLNYDKFVNLINKHDIVRLTETKTDDIDKTQKFNTWICHVYEKQEETYENPLQWHYASSQRWYCKIYKNQIKKQGW